METRSKSRSHEDGSDESLGEGVEAQRRLVGGKDSSESETQVLKEIVHQIGGFQKFLCERDEAKRVRKREIRKS